MKQYETTSSGRRANPLALKMQLNRMEITGQEKSVKKWTVYNDCKKLSKQLELTDNSFKVLEALIKFYPGDNLRPGIQLIVFAQNEQICERAFGMPESTLRDQINKLIEAGLILRKDSPNRKRYPVRDKNGTIVDAFGFDLSPLLLRSQEISDLVKQLQIEKETLDSEKKHLISLQGNVYDLIKVGKEEGVCANWDQIESNYRAIVERKGRVPQLEEVRAAFESLSRLRCEVFNILEAHHVPPKFGADGAEFRRRIEDSKPESLLEFESGSELDEGETAAAEPKAMREPLKVLPIGIVLRACPDIADYGPAGRIESWRDLMSAAVVVRSTLGVSPSAYQEACEVMGPENAAVAMACILERAGHVRSPGGYLRDLTHKAARDEFSLRPMLMALLRARGASGLQ